MSEFWNKVQECSHTNISPDYNPLMYCATGGEYCNATEEHCLDCGVYIGSCGCGSEDDMFGWAHRRWRNIHE